MTRPAFSTGREGAPSSSITTGSPSLPRRQVLKYQGILDRYEIAERHLVKRKHDCRAKDLHPDPYDAPRAAGDDLAQIVADRIVIRQALRQLPARQREAVTLRAVAGLSEAATARAMGVSIGSVKRYASEGRQELRRLLADYWRQQEGNKR
jgi:RNA polymerase sigma factor (sigma-70 family)